MRKGGEGCVSEFVDGNALHGTVRMNVRRAARPSLAALLLLIGVLVLWCGSASAMIARGHEFGFSFEGEGEATLNEPSGVAVDEATGEVYVVDRGHERVERFRPNGTGGYEFASAFSIDSPGEIAVDNSPSSPSKGDVYVAGSFEPDAEAAERDYVYVFSPSGEKLLKRSRFKAKAGKETVELELEDIQGLAVDTAGNVWVYWDEEGQIDGFSDAETLKWVPSLTLSGFEGAESKIEECSAREDFAVSPGDAAFYVGFERWNASEDCPGEQGEAPDPSVVAQLTGAGGALSSKEVDREDTTGVAVDPSTGDVYLDNGTSVAAFTSGGLLIQRFGAQHLRMGSGVAVDAQTGDVFVVASGEDRIDVFVPEGSSAPVVDSVTARNLTPSSAELTAQIDPRGEETEYYFQYGTADCALATSSCTQVPVPAGKLNAVFGDQTVKVEVTGLLAGTAYYYRVLASNALGAGTEGVPSPNTFTTLPSPSALPDGRAWEMVSPPDKHGAQIEALPFEGGAMIAASADGSAITWVADGPLVSDPEGNRGPELTQLLSHRGAGEWETQSLETPHDRGSGVETGPVPVEYQDFSSDLSLGLVEPSDPSQGQFGLLEQPPLSPEASEKTIYLRDDSPIAPGEGEKTAYEEAAAARNREYLSPGYLPLVTAANDTANAKFGGALEFVGATETLSHVVFKSEVGLTAPAPASGLYEWGSAAPLRLVSVLPGGTPASDPFLGDGESQDLKYGLNARNAISAGGSRVFWTEGKEQLYLRDTVRGETIHVNAAQGHGVTEPGEGGGEVSEPAEGDQEVHFQMASDDGARVFFTDTARLTQDATLEPVGEEGPADLYEFEVTSAVGEALRGRLTDLTPAAAEGSADVLNLIPGASEDGTYVYFVANGVLAPGASPGHCIRYYGKEAPVTGATCNLYVSEPDPEHAGARETKFIAALSNEDGPDWGAGLTASNFLIPEQDLSTVTSRVSPNGRYLAFMSRQSLTGYDNEDVTSKQPGERLDEEVFLYDASSDRLVCASCNPTGERPTGVFDTQQAGEGVGLLVDRTENWSEHWVAASLPSWTLDYGKEKSALYQARYLSDNGRLFFNSADALVGQVADRTREEVVDGQTQPVGVENVYEYEQLGLGNCQSSGGCVGLLSSGSSTHESAFLDASEDGDDAFFVTAAPLVPQDIDAAFDIYDARVCSVGSPCFSSAGGSSRGCESSATCRPGTAPGPQVAALPSITFSGPGNLVQQNVLASRTVVASTKPPTRAQRLASALRACRKRKRKHKRAVCEAQARERYGPKHVKKKAKKAAARDRSTRGAA